MQSRSMGYTRACSVPRARFLCSQLLSKGMTGLDCHFHTVWWHCTWQELCKSYFKGKKKKNQEPQCSMKEWDIQLVSLLKTWRFEEVNRCWKSEISYTRTQYLRTLLLRSPLFEPKITCLTMAGNLSKILSCYMLSVKKVNQEKAELELIW